MHLIKRLRRLMKPKPPQRSYWDKRKHMLYYQHVFALVSYLGRDAKSLIDIGGNGCPYLEWFAWIPDRVSVDRENPYASATVEGIQADFFTYEPDRNFEFCLCLQVLEHIKDAKSFARKLLVTAPRVMISVPYQWPEGRSHQHVHDPVHLPKVVAWFGRKPDFHMISTETRSGDRRLICYFQRGKGF